MTYKLDTEQQLQKQCEMLTRIACDVCEWVEIEYDHIEHINDLSIETRDWWERRKKQDLLTIVNRVRAQLSKEEWAALELFFEESR